MAYITHEHCPKCGSVQQCINGNCCGCTSAAFTARLEKWNSQTVEEKLLDLHLRMLRIEGSAVPPPQRY